MSDIRYERQVEHWGVFEARFTGPADGNPFVDSVVCGEFEGPDGRRRVDGFYDGGGEYAVRFMPEEEGLYRFSVSADFLPERLTGEFTATGPGPGNHGPVHPADTWHFRYADGTPYYSLGTTCYAWAHQSQELQAQTLATLRDAPFNKLRFCIFPKHYDYNYEDPITFPYEGTPCDNSALCRENMLRFGREKTGNHWDFSRFNPAHFRRFDQRIRQLAELGIEADLILFHPYDRWGFNEMGEKYDDLYVRYVIARFAAYRNVWWSLANEYDYIPSKTAADWERIGRLIAEKDPWNHPRSVHNGPRFFDFGRPWVTHCSCQGSDSSHGTDRYRAVETTQELRELWHKPVVWDEVLYEGNVDLGWGNIGAREMTRRFWEAAMRGGYVGHGETILTSLEDVDHQKLWWSHGGVLRGESPVRIAFLRDILGQTPRGQGLRPLPGYWDAVAATTEDMRGDYMIFYFSFMQPLFRDFHLDDEHDYAVERIDTWNMTTEPVGVYRGRFRIPMGGRPFMALRVRRV